MKSLAALLLFASVATPQSLGVVSVDPPREALDVHCATSITVTFDAPVDATTVDATSFVVVGRWSGIVPGSRSVSGSTLTFSPARAFLAAEEGVVQLGSSLRSTTGDPLVGGHAWRFWTRSIPGDDTWPLASSMSVRFAGEGLAQAYGIHAGDLDGDGAPDLSIPMERASDVRVALGDGCGAYTSPPIAYALPSSSLPSSNEARDLDGDGDLDLATANISGDSISILIGDGAGAFSSVTTYPSGNECRGLTMLDLEGDGDVDVAVASRTSNDVSLHRNAGDGTFGAPTSFEGGGNAETSIGAADVNLDGFMDLVVGHYVSANVVAHTNDGTGSFTQSGTQSVGGAAWMLVTGDVDADGDPDVATANSTTGSASVAFGDGSGGFTGVTTVGAGSFTLAIDLGDLDADGDLDMVASSFSSRNFRGFRNDGSGGFTQFLNLPTSNAGSCAVLIDDDRDGDVDVIGVDELADKILFFRQGTNAFAGVEPGSCEARLRVDGLAGSRGFGGTAPHPARLGATLFLGTTGTTSAATLLAIGFPNEPGTAVPSGTLNLAALVVLGAGATSAAGEALTPIPVPASLPSGLTLAFQGFVADPLHPSGGRLTNPEGVVTTP